MQIDVNMPANCILQHVSSLLKSHDPKKNIRMAAYCIRDIGIFLQYLF